MKCSILIKMSYQFDSMVPELQRGKMIYNFDEFSIEVSKIEYSNNDYNLQLTIRQKGGNEDFYDKLSLVNHQGRLLSRFYKGTPLRFYCSTKCYIKYNNEVLLEFYPINTVMIRSDYSDKLIL